MNEPPLLTAAEVGYTIDDDERVWPTVIVDATEHPEVADLARVHAVEGVGDVRTAARRITTTTGELFLVGVTLRHPVRAAFAVSFDVGRHGEFLDSVAEAGQLVVATTAPVDVERDRPLWLAIDLDGEAFRAALRG